MHFVIFFSRVFVPLHTPNNIVYCCRKIQYDSQVYIYIYIYIHIHVYRYRTHERVVLETDHSADAIHCNARILCGRALGGQAEIFSRTSSRLQWTVFLKRLHEPNSHNISSLLLHAHALVSSP